MSVIYANRPFRAVVHTVRVLLLLVVSGSTASAASLELQLEDEWGQLAPVSGETGVGNLLPVILGITNLRHRLNRAEADLESWQQTNDALATHLEEREAHMMDLQAFVERQDGTIEILTRQTQAMHALAQTPVTSPEATFGASAPSQPSSPVSFYGVALGSPYIEGAMVFVIIVLLVWTLYLRGQVRNAGREVAVDPVIPVPRAIPEDTVPAHTDVTPMDLPEPVAEDEKELVDLLHDYDRAAAALITTVGAGPVPEEHRLRLKRVLAGVAEKEEFLAEASALADDGDIISPSSDIEEVASQTFIMSTLDSPSPGEPDAAPPAEIPAKTQTNTAVLKEVDTLIAFENYEQASELLNKLLDEAPTPNTGCVCCIFSRRPARRKRARSRRRSWRP